MNDTTGYLLIIGILTISLILFIILLAISASQPSTKNTGFGQFGVMPNFDNIALNRCGTSKTDPCVFNILNVATAISQCNDLPDICTTFSYNESTKKMKIIDIKNSYQLTGSDIYSRNF